MPVQYSIQQGIIRMDFVGIYEPRDVVARFLDALNDPACPTPAGLLIDVRQSATLATRPIGDIRMVAEFLGPYADRIGGRCAVIAASDAHFDQSQLGALRSQATGISAQVFRTEEEALKWLAGTSLTQA
jgi:hypothetical protein